MVSGYHIFSGNELNQPYELGGSTHSTSMHLAARSELQWSCNCSPGCWTPGAQLGGAREPTTLSRRCPPTHRRVPHRPPSRHGHRPAGSASPGPVHSDAVTPCAPAPVAANTAALQPTEPPSPCRHGQRLPGPCTVTPCTASPFPRVPRGVARATAAAATTHGETVPLTRLTSCPLQLTRPAPLPPRSIMHDAFSSAVRTVKPWLLRSTRSQTHRTTAAVLFLANQPGAMKWPDTQNQEA